MSDVLAAPNESLIRGKILHIETQPSGKVVLQLEVTEVKPVCGPSFAEKGGQIEAFTFVKSESLIQGNVIQVKIEYIGGPHQGVYQILSFQN